jgi:transcriptional/translational regulatory protein YebC/TACO1
VSFMFEKKGKIQVLLSSSQSTDEFLMEAVDHGALDVTEKGPGDADNTRIVEVSISAHHLYVLLPTSVYRS